MSSNITEQKPKASIRDTFDTVAAGYDNRPLRFFQDSALNMAEYFSPNEDIHLLDVATGTGNAALTLARHLPKAKITGVDFSPGMLAQARAKATALKIANIEFLEMDMQSLEFPDGYFDAAVCAFGVFFVEEMERQLKHISDKVKSGGRVLTTCFYDNSFSPCADLFRDRIEQYGYERPSLRWKRIASEQGCISLFQDAGLTDIRVERKNLGYFLESADKWWEVVWNGGFRNVVDQLSQNELDKFKDEHLQEIEELRTKDGIWLNVEVLYTLGIKK